MTRYGDLLRSPETWSLEVLNIKYIAKSIVEPGNYQQLSQRFAALLDHAGSSSSTNAPEGSWLPLGNQMRINVLVRDIVSLLNES